MNRTRRLNVLSLILCFFIIVSSILGIVFSILEYGFIESLRTYGFIINCLLIFGSIYLFVCGSKAIYDGKDRTGKNIYYYMLVCSLSLFAYSILYLILINSGKSIIYKFTISCIFLQLVTPILSLILVITTLIKHPFDLKDSFLCMIPSIIYGACYFFMLLAKGKELDFYGLFENQKLWLSAIYILIFIFATLVLAIAAIDLHNRVSIFGSNSKLILRNGLMIPRVGFGTWRLSNEDSEKVISEAISVGYTHIDTANSYGNEEGIGKGIKLSGLERKKLFITTKIAKTAKDYNSAKESVLNSLKTLDLSYLDLVLIPTPQTTNLLDPSLNFDKENIEVWRALEDLYLEGKIKAIGVSNFNVHDLKNIINNCRIPPMVNQIRCYIGNTPLHLIRYCQKQKIVVEAYSTLNEGKIFSDKRVQDMALKYHISVASLSVRYAIDLGCVSLPKASTRLHMIENFDTDMRIKKDDIELMSSFMDVDFAKSKTLPIFKNREYYEID